MAERCGLRTLPEDILKSGIDGAVWEPNIPGACLRCLRRALSNADIARRVVHDSTAAADKELREMGIDPELVDRDHGIGIKLGDGAERVGIEDSGIDLSGVQGGWRTYIEEINFACPIEAYELTPTDKRFLYDILAPDIAYRPDGKEDGLTRYLYDKARQEPNAFLAMISAAEDFMDHDEDGIISMEELNELKIDRLLAMIADMPNDVDLLVRIDAWEIVLRADWLHWAEAYSALEMAVKRVAESDPEFLPHLPVLIKRATTHAVDKFKELTKFDENATQLIKKSNNPDVLSYVMDTYPHALLAYKSLAVLQGVWRQANRTLRKAAVNNKN